MTKHLRTTLVILCFFLLAAFMPKKYSPEYKKQKKGIESLSILNSVVQIEADNSDTVYADEELSHKNQQIIDSITFRLLSKKYDLEKVVAPLVKMSDFSDFFNQLENAPKELNKISSKQIFNKQITTCKSRYVLWLVYWGQIDPDLPPHYKLHSAVMNNTYIYNPGSSGSASDLRVVIIDTELEEIVYYDRISTSKYDARVSTDVIQMTRDMLKSVYYK